MKKLLLLSTAALLAAGASGCTDPCEDLEEVCVLCGDATYCESCFQLIEDNNQAVCDVEKSSFQQACVSPEGTCLGGTVSSSGTGSSSSSSGTGSSSSSGTTSSSSSTSSSGTGGTGGTGGSATGGTGGSATGGAGGSGGTGT